MSWFSRKPSRRPSSLRSAKLTAERLEDRLLMAAAPVDDALAHPKYKEAMSAVAAGRTQMALYADPNGAGGSKPTAEVKGTTLVIMGTKYQDSVQIVEAADGLIVNAVYWEGKTGTKAPIPKFKQPVDRIFFYGFNGNDEVFNSNPQSMKRVFAAGGAGNDLLIGYEAADFLDGGDGIDTLYGNGGNDVIAGGPGTPGRNDRASGDLLSGHAGMDILVGEDGPDVLAGYAGDDILAGGKGADKLEGGPNAPSGNDYLFGNADDDFLYGWDGNDYLDGGPGKDTLSGGIGDDTLLGGEGDDTLQGDSDNDDLFGGLGADELIGGTGNDSLRGDAADKKILGQAGADRFLVPPGGKAPGDYNKNDDSQFNFLNGNAQWTEQEIAEVNKGLNALRLVNPKLLVFTNPNNMTKKAMTFLRVQNIPGRGAENDTMGTIKFANAAFDKPGRAAVDTVHEMAHNWNNSILNPHWQRWLEFSWANGPAGYSPKLNAQFAYAYGGQNPFEDWATAWENHFFKLGYLPNLNVTNDLSQKAPLKLKIIDDFFRSL